MIAYVAPHNYSEMLRQLKPSVWLLHGYYPGGRNDPDNKKPA